MNLEGLPSLKQFLDTASQDVLQAVGEANRVTAFAMARRARSTVESALRDRGDLARAITVDGKGLRWRVGLEDRTVMSRARPGAGRRGGTDTAHVHPWVYGIWYELGFRSKNIQRRPFMVPAYNAEEQQYQARQEAAVNGALSRAQT